MNPLLQALVEGKPGDGIAGESPLSRPPPRQSVQKLRYNHEAMIDMLITKPEISQDELALIFDRSPSWISTILWSDLFQSRLAERRDKLVDPEVRLSIKKRMEGLHARSLEILGYKMDAPPDQVPDQLALQVAKVMGQNLGMGTPKVSVQETHVHLEQLGENLVSLLRRRKAEIIDGEVTPDPNGKDPQLPQGSGT